jgi:hypothetical protein
VHYVTAEKGGLMLLKGKLLLAVAAVACWAGQACAQSTLEQDAVAFGTRETTTRMDLSPDGKLAVFLGAGPGRTTIVYIADLAAGATKPIFYSKADPETLRWCAFASNTRLACEFTAIMKSENALLATNNGLISASRMISIGIDGKNMKQLGQPSSQYDVGLRQFDGEIIDWRPGGTNEVLMTRLFLPEGFRDIPSNIQRTKRGVGVVRLNVDTLATKIVEQPRDNVATWMSDGQGNVRLLGFAELSSEAFTTGRVKYVYRTPNSRDWKTLTDYVDTDGASGQPNFEPLAIDASINSLYALRKRNGRMALVKVELGDTPVETLVAENPRVDIDDVIRSGDGQRVIGYTYSEEYRHTVYFDPEYRGLSTALTQALPNHPVVDFVTASEDGSKLLIFAGTDTDPGRYYLFDKASKSLWRDHEGPPKRRQPRPRRGQAGFLFSRRRNDHSRLPHPTSWEGGEEPPVRGASARWAELTRRMGLRLARTIPRCPGLRRHPAPISRVRRVRRCLAGAERFQGVADLDRRHHRGGALPPEGRHCRPQQGRHRRLVLRRLRSAPIGRSRAFLVQGRCRDRSGYGSILAQD